MQNLKGKQFGRLTVLERSNDTYDKSGRRYITWKCLCTCGNITYVTTNNLHGKTTSCGCYLKEVAGKQTLKHGYRKTRLYRIYNGMKQRCNNPNRSGYENYGGRGISVCDEWNKPDGLKAFAEWALANGYEDGFSLERKDVNGNYEPNNCCWIPFKLQAKNTRRTVRVVFNNKTMIMSDFAKLIKVDHRVVSRALKNGMTPEEIVERYSK